jgi:hypothetical protein
MYYLQFGQLAPQVIMTVLCLHNVGAPGHNLLGIRGFASKLERVICSCSSAPPQAHQPCCRWAICGFGVASRVCKGGQSQARGD